MFEDGSGNILSLQLSTPQHEVKTAIKIKHVHSYTHNNSKEVYQPSINQILSFSTACTEFLYLWLSHALIAYFIAAGDSLSQGTSFPALAAPVPTKEG